MLRERALGALAASLAVALLGCPPQDQGTERRGGDDDVLTGAEVLGVARAINQGEIQAAQAVEGRLTQGAAAGLADTIVRDHTQSLQELERVSTTLSIVPEESERSRDLSDDVRGTIDDLSGKEPQELGKAFLDAQVDMHQKALELIDDELLPATTDRVMIDYLNSLRGIVFAHLESAKTLREDEVREHRGTMDPRDDQRDLEKEREAREDAAEERNGAGTGDTPHRR